MAGAADTINPKNAAAIIHGTIKPKAVRSDSPKTFFVIVPSRPFPLAIPSV
jgi:hypothetical protein